MTGAAKAAIDSLTSGCTSARHRQRRRDRDRGVQAFVALPKASVATAIHLVRLNFARYLALALEFQLASDVLQTAITPTLGPIRHSRGDRDDPDGVQLLSLS